MEKNFKVYIATISFIAKEQVEGTIQVPAESEEKARELIMAQHEGRENVQIHQIICADDIKQPEPQEDKWFEKPETIN